MSETESLLLTPSEKSHDRINIQVGGIGISIQSSSPVAMNWLRTAFATYGSMAAPQSRVVLRMLSPGQWRQAKTEAATLSGLQDCGTFLESVQGKDVFVLSEEKSEHELRDLLSRVLARVLPRHGAVLLHAAGVARNARGYLFFGPRGVGKSTAVALIADFDPEVRILGGDVIIVQAPEWGAPMIHTAPLGCRYSRLAPPPMQIAFDAAYRLIQDSRTSVEELTSGDGLRLLRESAEPSASELLYDGALEEQVQRVLGRVARSTGSGVRVLKFHRSAEFWKRVRA